jgi:hypothetical protein
MPERAALDKLFNELDKGVRSEAGALPIIKKNYLSAGPETRHKRSVCSRASKCTIERVPYLIF